VLVVLGAGAVVADAAGLRLLPPCPFHAATGLDCPGCGGTRAFLALAHGDVRAALDHHALLVLALPALVVGWVAWARATWAGRPARLALDARLVPAVVAVLLVFAVVRNLPGVPLLDAG